MDIGLSSYSFSQRLREGTMDVLDVIDWVAESKAAHLEIALDGLGVDLPGLQARVPDIKAHAKAREVPLVNYVVGADFLDRDIDGQISTLREHLDTAAALGITLFRHDVVPWAWREANETELEQAFRRIIPACQQVADYGAELGITTSVENHGFFLNKSDRVQRLMKEVDRENFRTTLDIGNSLCVGESPREAITRNLGSASIVHLKDFYIRDSAPEPGWLKTRTGNYLLGAVFGAGDMGAEELVKLISDSGYAGPLSIEFEGREDCLAACDAGLENALMMWEGCQ